MQRSDSSIYPRHKSTHHERKLSFSIKAKENPGENRKSFSQMRK